MADRTSTPGDPDQSPAGADNSAVSVASAPAQERSSAEVERLQAEVATLRGRLDTRQRRRVLVHRARAIIAALLVVLAGFGAVLSVIGIWGARTVFDTDRWVATVGPLPSDPQVNAAVATYLTTELQRTLNLQQRVADVLPPQAAFLAAPVGSAVRDYLEQTIQKLLQTPQFQALWEDANRKAQPHLVAILEDRSAVVQTSGDTVSLNLLPIVNNLLADLNQVLPNVFGKQITLPAVTSGEIPPNLREKIQAELGVTLPPDFANIEVANRGVLAQVQDAVVVAKRTVVLTILGTFVVLALAIGVSVNRRRTVLQFGLWLTLATLVLAYVLRLVNNRLLQNVPEGTYRNGASAAIHAIFTTLRERGDQLLWLGIIIALIAYLIGPGRLPVALRNYIVRSFRWVVSKVRSIGSGPGLRIWMHRHLDPVRIGGIIVAAVVALAFSSWTALFLILIVLGCFEGLVTLLARQGGELDVAGAAQAHEV